MSIQSIKLYNQLAKNKLFNKSINFNLKRIKLFLKKINNPEKKLKNVINIIGSDGKYSLLVALKYFIEANKQTASAYISPSLKSIRERFWVGKKYISYQEIQKNIKFIEKQKIPLTIFEVLTLIFIINACKRNNDYNLIEAGALFAKDSTNVFDFPKLQAVVNINKQHLNFVKKKKINEIIRQKVGFLSNFTTIYIGKQNSKNLNIIKKNLNKNIRKKIFSNSWKLIKIKNSYFYKDKKHTIKINSKYIYSKGLLENLAMSIKIALDLKIKKNIIKKTLPKIKFEGRIEYIKKGKLRNKINKKEQILLDVCHSKVSAKNLSDYLKTIKIPKYGIWGMTKNKDYDSFINQFKNTFRKIIVIPIERESKSVSSKLLYDIGKKNKFNIEQAKDFEQAIKKITSKDKKIICVFGSLYLCGSVLNKN